MQNDEADWSKIRNQGFLIDIMFRKMRQIHEKTRHHKSLILFKIYILMHLKVY